jgi:hypothetical protein
LISVLKAGTTGKSVEKHNWSYPEEALEGRFKRTISKINCDQFTAHEIEYIELIQRYRIAKDLVREARENPASARRKMHLVVRLPDDLVVRVLHDRHALSLRIEQTGARPSGEPSFLL